MPGPMCRATAPRAQPARSRGGRGVLLVTVAAALLGSCATAQPEPSAAGVIPVLVSSEIVRGPNRFLFTLTDPMNVPLASADLPVRLRFYDLDRAPDEVAVATDARFVPTTYRGGLYAASVVFGDAGAWATDFTIGRMGDETTVRVRYDVRDHGSTPAIGSRAPSADTPTDADVGGDLSLLSSDPSPDPRLYQLSIADALGAGVPFVVLFGTPAFCRTATCGATLETVEAVASDHPSVTFIHAEPYLMEPRNGSLQPVLGPDGDLVAAPWSVAWGLVTEPFVAVVDGHGLVTATFEGALAPEELRAALAPLDGPATR